MLVSPQRTQRPWLGQLEPEPIADLPRYDPECYLCPGNVRAAGRRNPDYESTLVFTNDYPALVPEDGGEYGTCRVVCYSPRHDLGLGDLPAERRRASRRGLDRAVRRPRRGSADRPCPDLREPRRVDGREQPAPARADLGNRARSHARPPRTGASQRETPTLLADYLAGESQRVVEATDHVVAVVPYWAVWPFETLVAPRRRCRRTPRS